MCVTRKKKKGCQNFLKRQFNIQRKIKEPKKIYSTVTEYELR